MKYCKYLVAFLTICLLSFCYSVDKKDSKIKEAEPNGKMITDSVLQDSLFGNLEKITQNAIPFDIRLDSLAFLLLPVEASCPACRNKTIDNIAKYSERLDEKHFVIVEGDGIKSISGYFETRHVRTPFRKGFFYDTLNITLQTKMIDNNPAIYYSFNAKVYRKINCTPSTIKGDLREFFAH